MYDIVRGHRTGEKEDTRQKGSLLGNGPDSVTLYRSLPPPPPLLILRQMLSGIFLVCVKFPIPASFCPRYFKTSVFSEVNQKHLLGLTSRSGYKRGRLSVTPEASSSAWGSRRTELLHLIVLEFSSSCCEAGRNGSLFPEQPTLDSTNCQISVGEGCSYRRQTQILGC